MCVPTTRETRESADRGRAPRAPRRRPPQSPIFLHLTSRRMSHLDLNTSDSDDDDEQSAAELLTPAPPQPALLLPQPALPPGSSLQSAAVDDAVQDDEAVAKPGKRAKREHDVAEEAVQVASAEKAPLVTEHHGIALHLSQKSNTGYRGVNKFEGRYKAYHVNGGKQKHLGIFSTAVEAAVAVAQEKAAVAAATVATDATPVSTPASATTAPRSVSSVAGASFGGGESATVPHDAAHAATLGQRMAGVLRLLKQARLEQYTVSASGCVCHTHTVSQRILHV